MKARAGRIPAVHGLSAPELAQLIQGGFCDPDPESDPFQLDRFVRPCDWLSVLWRDPDLHARGIAVGRIGRTTA